MRFHARSLARLKAPRFRGDLAEETVDLANLVQRAAWRCARRPTGSGMDSRSARVRTWARSRVLPREHGDAGPIGDAQLAETPQFSHDRLCLAGAVGHLDELHLALVKPSRRPNSPPGASISRCRSMRIGCSVFIRSALAAIRLVGRLDDVARGAVVLDQVMDLRLVVLLEPPDELARWRRGRRRCSGHHRPRPGSRASGRGRRACGPAMALIISYWGSSMSWYSSTRMCWKPASSRSRTSSASSPGGTVSPRRSLSASAIRASKSISLPPGRLRGKREAQQAHGQRVVGQDGHAAGVVADQVDSRRRSSMAACRLKQQTSTLCGRTRSTRSR